MEHTSRYTDCQLCPAQRKKPTGGGWASSEKRLGGKLFFWFINLNTQVNMQEYSNPRAYIKRAS